MDSVSATKLFMTQYGILITITLKISCKLCMALLRQGNNLEKKITFARKKHQRDKNAYRHFCSVTGNRNNIRAFVSPGNSFKKSQFCNEFELSNLRTAKRSSPFQ